MQQCCHGGKLKVNHFFSMATLTCRFISCRNNLPLLYIKYDQSVIEILNIV